MTSGFFFKSVGRRSGSIRGHVDGRKRGIKRVAWVCLYRCPRSSLRKRAPIRKSVWSLVVTDDKRYLPFVGGQWG